VRQHFAFAAVCTAVHDSGTRRCCAMKYCGIWAAGSALAAADTGAVSANPIRRVVSLLQSMQSKIEAEGEEQDKLFAKFQCYCESNSAKLSDSIAAAKSQIEALGSDIESATEDRKQTVADLQSAKDDRESANKSIEDATQQRKKENTAFEKSSSDLKTNIAALSKAIPAIENNMVAFLQSEGSALKKAVEAAPEVSDYDKSSVESYLQSLSGSESGYTPQSGEIVGILKQMHETMEKELAEITKTEGEALTDFNEMVASQNKAIQAATDTIEEKTEQSGALAVQIVQLKNERDDADDQLKADTGYSAQLDKDCTQQTAEYAQVKQTRADELLAIADTIKILNDDDVLDLFKKAIPSLLQVRSSTKDMAKKALKFVRSSGPGSPRLDLIALALQGKNVNFDKVLKMVDQMIDTLKKEQTDDDAKQTYCKKEFDTTEDEAKEIKHHQEHLDQTNAELQAAIKDAQERIATLTSGIKDLDKSVAEATETRKEEHDSYIKATAQDQAAVQILEFAKNRLQKFYNPKLHKEGPKRELSEEEKMYSAYGGDLGTTPAPGGLAGTGVSVSMIQVSSLVTGRDEPPPAPKMGGYKKQQGGGVLGMIDRLVNDLKTEMNENKLEENDAQQDYEQLMKDSADKRAADSKAISEAESVLAEAQSDLSANKDDLRANAKKSKQNHEYNQDLHKTCDFLLDNYDARKKARTDELEGLDKAKAILSGADFSLIQTTGRKGSRFLA